MNNPPVQQINDGIAKQTIIEMSLWKKTKVFFRDYGATILELIATVYSGLLYYILSDEGSKRIISFLYPDYSSEVVCINAIIFQQEWAITLLAIWIALVVFTLFVSIRTKKALSQMERKEANMQIIIDEQKEQLKQYALLRQNIDLIFKYHLISIGNSLRFSHDERISLYIIHKNRFVCCARHSNNPMICKPGRASYPLDEGIISEAWRTGKAFSSRFPNIKKGKDEYARWNKLNYSIPEEVVNGFSMFPRLMFGYRISNSNLSEHNAVVIIESNRKNYASEGELIIVLQRNMECLFNLIKDFYDYIPALARAEEENI